MDPFDEPPAVVRAAGSSIFHPELGPQFFKRLLTEMDLVLSQDPRQAVDWLAQGKLAFLLFTSPAEVLRAKAQKLPVDILDPRRMKEAPVVETAASSFMLMDKPANPNAAKTVYQLAAVARRSDLFSKEPRELRFALESIFQRRMFRPFPGDQMVFNTLGCGTWSGWRAM